MIVDNGSRQRLEIDGVFEGIAGVAGAYVSFVPNRFDRRPQDATAGVLNGVAVLLSPRKDPTGPFWTSRFTVLA